MRYIFQQWDGNEFPTQEHLQYFSNFMEYLLEYGEGALQALEELTDDPEQRKIIEQWLEDTAEELDSNDEGGPAERGAQSHRPAG